jgi:hypothetical protein
MACQSDVEQPVTEQTPADQQMPPNAQAAELEVSDEELESFVNASGILQEIQMNKQQEMIAVVEDEGLEVDTYNQIAQARFMGEPEEELEISPEDREKFDNAYAVISDMEAEMEKEMASALEDEAIDYERYQTINIALRQDPALQQRVQSLMQESFMQEQPQPEPEPGY